MFSLKEAILPAISIAIFGALGISQANKSGPQMEMPQVQFATEATNQKINTLLREAMDTCLETGNIKGKQFLEQKRQILGDDAHHVKAKCGRPEWKKHEFRMQIGNDIFRTRDGKRFDPVESLSLR